MRAGAAECVLLADGAQSYMMEMIRARREAEKKEERYDLFSSLLDANEEETDGQTRLSNSEVMGNIFVFLIAGHEVCILHESASSESMMLTRSPQTTAHTLAFTFIMLALYQDEQEILYQHIQSVVPEDRTPVGPPVPIIARYNMLIPP